MSDAPDLMTELDAAEDIVMGRADRIATDWAVACLCGGVREILVYDDEEDARRHLLLHSGSYLVRRMVTYGPWEDVKT